jgi:ABC-type tungstate transport system substrate-binding protein
MNVRRVYSFYLLFGVVICVAVAVGAVVKHEYVWVVVGVGGAISCGGYVLRRTRNQTRSLPTKSKIARWRESRNG